MKKYTLLFLVCIWLMVPLHSEIVAPTVVGYTQVFNVLGQGFFVGYYPITATCQKIGSSYYIFTEDVRVNDISISPTDPNNLLIATSSGVYVSYDAGVSWKFASGSGTDVLGPDYNGANYPEASLNIVHRAPIDAAFYMKDGQWWAGYEDGIYQTKDDGVKWSIKTRGLPSYIDPVDLVSVFPPFYYITWDDQVTDFDANKDYWACSQGGLFYWSSSKFIDMGNGLPQTISDWAHLSVFDFVKSGDRAYIATELGLYTGTINMAGEMVSWQPIGGDDITITSSVYDSVITSDLALTAYLSGASQNTYVNVIDAAKSLYWRCKVEKSGDDMVIAITDEDLYFSDAAVFDPTTLDYSIYDVSAATVYQPANVSVSKLALAGDGTLYFVAGTEILKLNSDQSTEVVYDAATGINDIEYYSDNMYIATGSGLFRAAMTDLSSWTKETGTLMEGSTNGDTLDYDVRTIEFDASGNMYVGCYMGGLIRKEAATGTWTNLNVGLGHRAIVPEKTNNVALAFDSLTVQAVLEPWFGEVPNTDNDAKQYCLIVDLDDFYYLNAGDGTSFIDGFFNPVDQLSKSENVHSNEMDIIYIDSNPLDLLSTDALAAVTNAMTVEILQSKTVPEEEWVYRGLAELGELILGLKDTVTAYGLNSNNSLIAVGDIVPEVKDYDYSFAFFDYLYCHYFTDAAKMLAYASLDESGIEGVSTALADISGPSFKDVFSDFAIAVYFDELTYSSIPVKYQFSNLNIKKSVTPLGWGYTENSDGPYLRNQTSWSFYYFKTTGIAGGYDKSPNFSRTVVFNGEDEASFDFNIVLQNSDGFVQDTPSLGDKNIGIANVADQFGAETSEYQELYFIVAAHETPDVGGTSFFIFDKSAAASEFSIGFNYNVGAPDYLNLFCYSDYQMFDDAGKAKLYDSDGNGTADLEGPVGTLVVDGDTTALALEQFYVDASNNNYIYSMIINISDVAESGSGVSINLVGENLNSVTSQATATGTLAKISASGSRNLVFGEDAASISIKEGTVRNSQTMAAFISSGNLAKQVQAKCELGNALSDILYVSAAGSKLEKPISIRMHLQNNDISTSDDVIPVVFLAQDGEFKAIAQACIGTTGDVSFETDQLGSFQVFLAKKEVLSEIVSLVPDKFGLMKNFPNPFNSSTSIRYQIPRTADVQILIYDLMGRQIKTLYQGEQNAGYYTIEWNGLSDDNRLLPSGVYLYRMVSGDFQATEKMIYLK